MKNFKYYSSNDNFIPTPPIFVYRAKFNLK